MRIIQITDNGGITIDRYTVYILEAGIEKDEWTVSSLALSANCNSPQGVSVLSEVDSLNWYASTDGIVSYDDLPIIDIDCNEKEINWYELPVNVRAHVAERLLL